MKQPPKPLVLFAIRGNHHQELVETPTRFFAGDWREADHNGSDKHRGVGFADVLDASSRGDGRVLIAFSEGWTFISLSHPDVVRDSTFVAARLSGQLGAEVFLVNRPKDWETCWIGMYDGAYRTIRFIQMFEPSEEGGGVYFGPPHDVEQGLSEFWSSDTGLEMFKRWGGPAWIADKDPGGVFELATFLELSPEPKWFETDALLLRLQNRDWFRPMEPGESKHAPIQKDFSEIGPKADPEDMSKYSTRSIGRIVNAITIAVIVVAAIIALGLS